MMAERKSIILVDDNLTNLNAGKDILKAHYRTFPVPSAAGLFELLEDVRPDLILLDIEMPEMDGYEAIRKLKAEPKWRDIPVMFITARDGEYNKEEGLQLGAVDYLVKPFSSSQILKHLEDFFKSS